jgi:hypothetical protein
MKFRIKSNIRLSEKTEEIKNFIFITRNINFNRNFN